MGTVQHVRQSGRSFHIVQSETRVKKARFGWTSKNSGNAKSKKDYARQRANHAKASIYRDSRFYKEVLISPNPKEGPHSVEKCIRQEMSDKEVPPSNGGGGAINNTNIEKQTVSMQNEEPNDSELKSFVVYNHAISDSDLEWLRHCVVGQVKESIDVVDLKRGLEKLAFVSRYVPLAGF
ncbi:hypothetical protein DITRI_Ditri08aG0092300 [Diplodiscus trichospermus]